MRRSEHQLSLTRPAIDHPHAAELDQISRILDANPRMAALVAQDLRRGVDNPHTGKPGLSGDQVLRMLIVKQMTSFSYEVLGFHLVDSVTYRNFCRLGALEPVPARSTVAENLKKVSQKTLEKINRRLVRYAGRCGVETGKKVRVDATVTETNIHAPSDSSLLVDGVRVLVRLLARAQELCGFALWSDHTKRAKRRMLAIQHTGSAAKRQAAYQDLVKVANRCVGYAERAVVACGLAGEQRSAALLLADQLQEVLEWTCVVIDQTERRVFRSEMVPPDEKVLSIFEPHTDIVKKDRGEPLYGHKLFLSAGASGLITDCLIAEGNPADSTMALPMLRRQKRILGCVPEQAALDGGFASKANLHAAKELGITDVAFSKKRGLEISAMTRSAWVYRCLRNFRAGIEGLISFLKRAFGLDRCTWRGALAFGSYVMASIVSANLLTLARHLLA